MKKASRLMDFATVDQENDTIKGISSENRMVDFAEQQLLDIFNEDGSISLWNEELASTVSHFNKI